MTWRAHGFAAIALLTAGWLSGAAVSGQQQRPPDAQLLRMPAGTATVSGTVVDSAQPPRPVRRARVTVRPDGQSNGWSATTDDEGRFVIAGIAAGRHILESKKAAWVTGRYGATRPGRPGIPIVVNDGATLQGLTIVMSRGATISGTVVSRSGEPMPGVAVTATGARIRNSGTDVVTDDEGRFRLYGHPPGEYGVLASFRSGPAGALMDLLPLTETQVTGTLRGVAPSSSSTVGYASLYAPGVVSRAQALTIKLGAEEERDGVNITLSPVPTSRITVSVDPGDAGDPASISLFLVPHESGGASLTGRRGGDGRYVFTGVAPIAYTAMARGARLGAVPAAAPSAPVARGRGSAVPLTLYATEELAVTGGEMNVSLRLQPGMALSGAVVVDPGAPATTRASDAQLALVSTSGTPGVGVPSIRSAADGSFKFDAVPPGRYRLLASSANAVEARSARSRGVEVLDELLEVRAGEDVTDFTVTLPARQSELAGLDIRERCHQILARRQPFHRKAPVVCRPRLTDAA